MEKRNNLSDMKTKIRLLPTDLKLLFWFSISFFFTFTLLMIFAREQLYEEIIPYTGWSPGNICFFLAFIIAVPKTSIETTESNLVNFTRIRYKVVLLLGIYLVFGIYDWFDSAPEFYNHTNPYLRYDSLRPLYTIFLPLLWTLIVGWPIMKDFLERNQKLRFK
ncbi:hypothetical protein FCR2A7T_06840 [Flavobacterium cauense R2A-7]|uniref:hypothetical protein n=1 Tax=Flavobacterium cauense TaxID=510946 RepID=UPI0003C5AFEE|nr:hypothetical protein [Flavobacterium cauense]ESU21256.1 hypothetical protein FCR2A7T_06840 [Flavobacterium cauense R2A-7]KGO79023.1 hypothetical protein Q762_14750 [Flavobacterium cauense R2A-7]